MTALDRTRLTGPSRSMFGTDGAPRKRMLSGRAFLLLGRGTVFGSPQNIFTANRAYGRIKWRHEHRFVATKKPQSKISAVFLVEVTGLEPTTSWSLRRRRLCSPVSRFASDKISPQRLLSHKKCCAFFMGPRLRDSALVLGPSGGTSTVSSQQKNRRAKSLRFFWLR